MIILLPEWRAIRDRPPDAPLAVACCISRCLSRAPPPILPDRDSRQFQQWGHQCKKRHTSAARFTLVQQGVFAMISRRGLLNVMGGSAAAIIPASAQGSMDVAKVQARD